MPILNINMGSGYGNEDKYYNKFISGELNLGGWFVRNNSYYIMFNTYLPFSLATIPTGVNIKSAKLTIDIRESGSYSNCMFTLCGAKGTYPNWTLNSENEVFTISSGTIGVFEIDVTSLILNSYANNFDAIILKSKEGEKNAQVKLNPIATLTVTYEGIPPVNLQPKDTNIIGRNLNKFEWSTNGVTQKNYILAYSYNGGSTWTEVTGTINNYHSFDNLPIGNVLWKVKISDGNIWSEWSINANILVIGNPSTPSITTATLSTSTPKVEWQSTEQVSYQVQILKGVTVALDTYEVNSFEKFYNLMLNLENNTSYTMKVKVKNIYNLWSDWGSKTLTTNFPQPNIPTVVVVIDDGFTKLSINNPSGGTEIIKYNEIWRSYDNIIFERIANYISNIFIDYTAKSNIVSYYKVKAISEHGFSISNTVNIYNKFNLKTAQLLDIITKQAVNIEYNANKKFDFKNDVSLIKCQGRKKRVSEFSEHDADLSINISFTIDTQVALNTIYNLFNKKQILLYRDNRGRSTFAIISNLAVSDDNFRLDRYNIEMTLQEVDYSEVV